MSFIIIRIRLPQLKIMINHSYTVLPPFTRLPWQIKNRVNQNLRYTSHSMDKIIVQKNVKKISIKLKFYTIRPCFANFLDKMQKLHNRKPRNGKPRKTRDYCSQQDNRIKN